MNDLTAGPIPRHLLRMAVPIAIGMLFQTLYVLVDLYFVAQLGDAAIAGVGAAAAAAFVVLALTQVLGVGTVTLIAQAVGRKDLAEANLAFNQSLMLSAGVGVATLVGGWLCAEPYMAIIGADPGTAAAGTTYLHWYMPGLALQFALVALGSALRGTGIAKPTMVVQLATVLLNALLAPVLISGWLTGLPLGVAGAGLASSIAIAVGVVMLWGYFRRLEHAVGFDATLLRPRRAICTRMLAIGLPAGGEFALMFVYMAVIYWLIRDFGPAAQAGFGIGSRVMQSIFLPAVAIAFAVSPIAGQNFGAGQFDRVRTTFTASAWMGSALMLALTLVCQWRPEWLVHGFTDDPAVLAVATMFLQIISWNFVASGLNLVCSGMFQGLGNTLPALLSSATRLLTFVLPALWLAQQPGFELRQLWLLSVATVALQALLSLLLLRVEFRRRLPQAAPV